MGALTHRKGLSLLVGTLTGKLVEAVDCDFVLVKPASYRTEVELTSRPMNEIPYELENTPVPQPSAATALGFVSPWQLPAR
jgi:hypothetical protein